jgi:FkbH-like protein
VLERDGFMAESVRLVIWDLDETFWRGTLTEGGIQYVQEHQNVVIELARRGIMSSICSKNDEATVLRVLQDHDVAQYFIFPSISWEPKGPRLQALIDDVQLRAPSVMFIDDNASNRAEASAVLPGLQVADESYIPHLLSDPRFLGKDDHQLTRLAQYKLLEQRKREERAAKSNATSNQDFLAGCDIRIYLEHNVAAHIDRAVELINRTNQLNFTKIRLPENEEAARSALRADLDHQAHQAALVRVVDKYGDYGFVGFYLLVDDGIDPKTGKLLQRLKHYCFSCRVLGMKVETFLYDQLRRPNIWIDGAVLTDLSDRAPVTWIRQVESLDNSTNTVQQIAAEIRVHGGCEATAIAHYLTPYAKDLKVTGNFHAANAFFRVNSALLMLSANARHTPEFAAECAALGVPAAMLTSDLLAPSGETLCLVLGFQLDNGNVKFYRHKTHNWLLHIEPHGVGVDLVSTSEEKLIEIIKSRHYSPEATERVITTAFHIHRNYTALVFDQNFDTVSVTRAFLKHVPDGARVVMITDHDRVRVDENKVIGAPWAVEYRKLLETAIADLPHVAIQRFSDCISGDEEINIGGNHYNRLVYQRMGEQIVEKLKRLPGKAAQHT